MVVSAWSEDLGTLALIKDLGDGAKAAVWVAPVMIVMTAQAKLYFDLNIFDVLGFF